MKRSRKDSTPAEKPEALTRELLLKHAFGPPFFLGQLAAFVRERCPDPSEHLPVVELRLNDGEILDVCHVIGLAPRWVAIAARDRESDRMVTVLVPYELIVRVDIRACSEERRVGFTQNEAPVILDQHAASPQQVLRSAAGPTETTSATRPA